MRHDFMIGDNDKVSECNIEELASKIVATTSYFHYAWHIPSIAVTQLLPRLITRHLDNARYDAQALQINACLKKQIAKLPYMTFLQHDFTRFKAENEARFHNLNRLFHNTVHLNDAGNYKLYKSLQSVVIQVCARQENATVSQSSL